MSGLLIFFGVVLLLALSLIGLIFADIIDVDKLMGREEEVVDFELEVENDVDETNVEKAIAKSLDVKEADVSVQVV